MKMHEFAGLSALAAALSALSAAADTVAWTNVMASSSYWGYPHNWTNEAGEVLEMAPTNGAYDVRFPSLPTDNNAGSDGQQRTVDTGNTSASSGLPYLAYPACNPDIVSIGPVDDVWDTWCWTISHAQRNTEYVKPNFTRVFKVAYPDAFDGYWTTAEAKAIYELPATPEHVPTMSSLGAHARPYVRVPDAGTTAAIQAIHQSGTVVKTGAGELRIGATMGADTRLMAETGTLTLEGTSDAALDALLKTAALRLDATRTDTLLKETRTIDGVAYTCVTNWHDVNGNGNNAYWWNYSNTGVHWYRFTRPPFVSPVESPTGLPLVDFGSRVAQNGEFGPSNCFLKLTRDITDPRAVFYAVQTPGGAGGCTILGDVDNVMGFVSEGGLFCSYGAGRIARTGDIMINAEPKSYPQATALRSTTLTNLNVISVATRPGAKIALLGSDRYYASRSGGSRLGEVLIFTNELTRAQRVRVAQYLTRKWVTGAAALDANAVLVKSSAVSVGVPEGRTARVTEVIPPPTGAFRKTGGGTLEIGRLMSTNGIAPAVSVEGGAVRFTGVAVEPSDAPAADPYIWLDANDWADRMTKETFDGYDATYVSLWRDHRADVDLTAIAISNAPPRMPFLVDDIGNGMKGVSLGKGTSSSAEKTQCHFILPTWGVDGEYGVGNKLVSGDTYAGFIVCRFNIDNDGYNIFGSSNMEMMRSNRLLLHYDYTALYSPSAFWSINGVAVDPFGDSRATLSQTNDLVLVAFRSPMGLTVNAIAKDRRDSKNYKDNCGNLTVCEFITYHRPLTDAEFRATEAYLLKKWKGVDHPAAESAVAISDLTVTPGAAAELGAEGPMTVSTLTGGGSIVKTGSGAVEVEQMPSPATAAGGIAVEEGALKLDLAPTFTLARKAIFHFDASRPETFTTYEGEDGKTYVTRWDDVSTNGLYGCSYRASPKYRTGDKSYTNFVMTNPTLETVTMPDGVARTVVNFGGLRNTASMQETGSDSASIYFSRVADGTQAATVQTRVREIYVVERYRELVDRGYANFIGNLTGAAPKANAGSTIYMRGGQGLFHTTYTSLYVQNGYLATNRGPATATTTIPAGWHLLSVGATDFTRVDSIMHDRDCNAGGGSVAEMIAFDFELTAAERTALEQSLMRKWGLGAEPAPTLPTDSVRVEAGASLDAGDCTLTTGSLAGGGMVTATALAVAAGADLSFTYRTPSDVDHLTVDGTLSFAGGATVHVAVADADAVEAGEWPLVTATGGITGFNLASVALDSDFAATRWTANLFVRDGALWLRVQPKGTMILLR